MKNWIIVAALICIGSVARAENGSLDLDIGSSGFSIGVSTTMNDTYVVGGWDFLGKEAVAGYGKELFPIKKNGTEIAYIAGHHLFYSGEAGRGAFGLALGVRPIAMINTIGTAVGTVGTIITLPVWTEKINKLLSVEVGYSRRGVFETVPDGHSANVFTVGGQIAIPIGDWYSTFSK